ncbi:MAG: GNAT family N-acetyltransferase [Planctomycetaceae bacterium]|jgi:predicted acetyltransferase|nr:GNAT family N-acetyltransferase [Planctomycetaceae bacterium]
MMLTVCPTIEVVKEQDLNEVLDWQIRELLRLCFPDWADIFQNCRTWHNTRPIYSVLARDADKVIGHIAVVVRAITTTWNFRYNVASIQGVCVTPDSRHAGFAHRMLREALNEATQRGFLFAILYCKEFLVPFYISQGWKLADDSIVMWNQRDLPISMRSNCPMYYELSNIPLPEGPLDVHSPTW